MSKKAVIGIAGISLTSAEINIIIKHKPYGIILFKRNCENEQQLMNLTTAIKAMHPDCKIFIDQEGGRVARLRKPNFREFPAANSLCLEEQVYNNYYDMGNYLKSFNIDVNCAPVLDLHFDSADNIIGDRSFGKDPAKVAILAKAAAKGLINANITPIVKHIPGHGRALVDSHIALPIVKEPLSLLEETDFYVFKELNTLPMAMTAHIVYECLDAQLPATLSKKVISYIRKEIGFNGIIISDDINMKALKGSLSYLTTQIFEAGCDLVLHCSGNIKEMEEVLASTPNQSD